MSLKNNLKKIYKLYFPAAFASMAKKKEAQMYAPIQNKITTYLEARDSKGELNNEEKDVLTYLKGNTIFAIPHTFIKEYDHTEPSLIKDPNNGLYYTVLDGKKLYFNAEMVPYDIKRAIHALLIEQDIRSPHRYLTPNFDVDNESVFIDVGAAEGNLSLQVIDKVKKVYLIEADPSWKTALEATFAPWRDKVEIIYKFASDKVSDSEVSIDSIFEKEKKIDFIKIDVEGAEEAVLRGAQKTFASSLNHLKLVLCTYHKQGDAEKFSGVLQKQQFDISFSNGYMIFLYGSEALKQPYLRKGLIRAQLYK